MRAQYLDRMDIERERGITIKSQAVRLPWTRDRTGKTVHPEPDRHPRPRRLHLRGEPRSLAACEGAVLLVDAAQGIEAQTLANLYLALENDLHDHPGAQQDRPAGRAARASTPPSSRNLIGCARRGLSSGVGQDRGRRGGVARRDRHRSCRRRSVTPTAPARAMIFDSVYDTYRGVVTYVRVIDGHLSPRERILMLSTGATHELLEIGVIAPSRCRARAGRGRGRLPHHRGEGRPAVTGRRHRDQLRQAGQGGARRLQGPDADGLLRPVPAGRLGLPGAARGPRQAPAQRRRARLRAGDLGGAGLRLPLRVPRPAAPGDRPGAARARVRPRPDLHRAQRGLPGGDGGRHRARRHQPQRVPWRARSRPSTSRWCAPR